MSTISKPVRTVQRRAILDLLDALGLNAADVFALRITYNAVLAEVVNDPRLKCGCGVAHLQTSDATRQFVHYRIAVVDEADL